MADLAKLVVKMEAESSKLRTDLRASQKRIEKFSKKSRKNLDGLKRAFGGLAAAAGIGILTKKIINNINVYSQLSNRLKLVTTDSKNLADIQKALFDVAQDTRGSLESSIDLYTRLARSTKVLGISQERLLGVTESINQAIAISGSDTQASNAAIIQLGQGLAAGALRGQELNSVMEQTPRLAQALSDGLGVTIGELRELGKAGKISAAEVIRALENQAGALRSEFNRTSKTIAQAMQQIENVWLQTTGSLDNTDMVKALDDFRKNLQDPAIANGLKTLATALIKVTTLLVSATSKFADLGRGIGVLTAQLFNPNTEDRLRQLKKQINELNEAGSGRGRPVDPSALKALQAEYDSLLIKQKKSQDFLNSFTKPEKVEKKLSVKTLVPVAAIEKDTKKAKKLINDLILTGAKLGGSDEGMKKYLDLLRQGQDVFEDTRTPIENLQKETEKLNILLKAGAIDWDTYARAVFKADKEFDDTQDKIKEKTKELTDVSAELGLTFSSAFEDAIVDGGKLSDILKGLEKDISRILARKIVTEPLAQSITGLLSNSGGGSGGGNFLSSIFGSIFGGGKALGGPVSGGTPYLVGEQGPEMFIPNVSGNIIPNNKTAGTTTINVNVSGINDEGGLRQSAGQIAAAVSSEMRRGQRNL